MLFIGIDLGTSACKLLLVGEDGTIQNEVTKEYPLSFPHPGWAEQRPEDWWDAVVAGVPELLRGFDANDVAGIGSGGQMRRTTSSARPFSGTTAERSKRWIISTTSSARTGCQS